MIDHVTICTGDIYKVGVTTTCMIKGQSPLRNCFAYRGESRKFTKGEMGYLLATGREISSFLV